MEFIPVTINETFASGVDVTVHGPIRPFRTTVEQVYQFQKPHEPQKVVVPKFVAEWIEELKKSHSNLAWVWEVYPNEPKIKNWLESNTETFMRAWLDGYEVEQEKLYTVEIPNNGGTLVLASINHAIKLVDGNKHFPGKFTKESIEYADFGWVFDCSGVKVVEAE
ncbi:TPA: DUF1642 domain-containing protein [Streptococcus suis]|nr:DUF1642 domain-containing protein [Streptococcus suis]